MLSSLDVIIRLSFSFLCGLLIGIERQLNNKLSGIHTCVLVCIGSCLFIFVGSGLNEVNSPSRIAAQIVTGTGFLGSEVPWDLRGVIVKDINNVKGLNTAATKKDPGSFIDSCSAIGCLCGCGYLKTFRLLVNWML